MEASTGQSSHSDVSELLEAMDASVEHLRNEVSELSAKVRAGDPSAYWTYKVRRRELKELSKKLKDLTRRQHKRSLRIA